MTDIDNRAELTRIGMQLRLLRQERLAFAESATVKLAGLDNMIAVMDARRVELVPTPTPTDEVAAAAKVGLNRLSKAIAADATATAPAV